jgi:hypothetical protein
MREEAEKEGIIHFGKKRLGRGEIYATLWNLRILHESGRAFDHTSLVEPALAFLRKHPEAMLDGPPDLAALAMTMTLALGGEPGRDLARQCLKSLKSRQNPQGRWEESPLALGMEGEVASALVQAVPWLGAPAAEAAEMWLEEVFALKDDEKLTEWPQPFLECRSQLEADPWIEIWIMAVRAASCYLAVRRPDHDPVSFLLAYSVTQGNELARAEEMVRLALPYLPPLPEIQKKAAQLELFWQSAATLDKSVYILCPSSPAAERNARIQAITEALWKHGLVARYPGEGGAPLVNDPWENAALFMTGCRYGIALLEQPDEEATPSYTAPELVYQVGFMRGQGKPLLVLWDRSIGGVENIPFPGVQVPMEGIESKGFDRSEENLSGLRREVEAWAAALLKAGEKGAG